MPDNDRKLRVFLCHASQDKPVVRELYQRLLAERWIDPWLDEEKLLPGQDWDMEIEKAVEASDAVVVCLSSHSVGKEGYVQRELRFVLDIALEKPEGTIFVIPLRLNNCEVPRRLRLWQYADYFPENRKSAYDRLLISLKARNFAIGKASNELKTDSSVGESQVVLDEYSIFLLDEENEKLNQLKAVASRRYIYGSTNEKYALRMELLQTISPRIRYLIGGLSLPVSLLLTFSVSLLAVSKSIPEFFPLYCLLFLMFFAIYIVAIGFLYRKLIDVELNKRIEQQQEKIKRLI